MTDPVDTDATAELAALDMDLLRKDVAFWIEQSDIWKRLANDERDVTDRLRAALENAPHDIGCASPAESLLGVARDPNRPCNCWKADAL